MLQEQRSAAICWLAANCPASSIVFDSYAGEKREEPFIPESVRYIARNEQEVILPSPPSAKEKVDDKDRRQES